MKILFIANPRAGGGRHFQSRLNQIASFIDRHRLAACIAVTERPRHATELATDAVSRGCTHIAAIGGDGTVNEIACVLQRTQATLAIVPCGSGDGLARHLGVPRAVASAMALLLPGQGRTLNIDTGAANGHFFCNVMGFGLDAEIAARFNQLETRGWAAYGAAGLACFVARKARHCFVVCDGIGTAHEVLLMSVANSDQYGNRAFIAPGASVTDGQLDLIAIKPVGLLSAACLAARLLAGNLNRSVHVERISGRHFIINRESVGWIHTDGEVHEEPASIEVTVASKSLNVLVPAGITAMGSPS